MKIKITLIFSLILMTIGLVWADSHNETYRKQQEYYNKMKTCTPYSMSFKANIFGKDLDFKYSLLGVKNGLCYIKQIEGGVITNCRFPKSVAVKYADEELKMLEGKNVVGYSDYVNQIINDRTYCSIDVEK